VTRCRPEFEQAIYDDLAWLGLAWEEPVRRQSEHIAEYAARLDELKSRGLVYPVLLLAQGDRRRGVGARSGNGCAMAARSGRRAALSGHLPRS
jgi:glutamyl-Q tRNA(Asp) synthetase